MRWEKIKYPVFLACCFHAVTAQGASCQIGSNEREIRSCFEKASSCGTIVDPSKRLSFYDELYKPNDQAASSDPGPKDKPTTAATPFAAPVLQDNSSVAAQLDDEKFPLSKPAARIETSVQMRAKIVKLRKGPRGKMTISLDNSQIWRENEASTLRYRIGTAVTIKKGLLGSNNLTIEGQSRRAKVRRVQ